MTLSEIAQIVQLRLDGTDSSRTPSGGPSPCSWKIAFALSKIEDAKVFYQVLASIV